MKKQYIYIVTAYRWGSDKDHSYVVSVRDRKKAALDDADTEDAYRGGKYSCEVVEMELNSSIAGNHNKSCMSVIRQRQDICKS